MDSRLRGNDGLVRGNHGSRGLARNQQRPPPVREQRTRAVLAKNGAPTGARSQRSWEKIATEVAPTVVGKTK